MLIIGCEFHTRYQQIAMAREETGELLVERRLDHESSEAKVFYRSLQSLQEPVCVGIEATGPIHWFKRLLAELGHVAGDLRLGLPRGASSVKMVVLERGFYNFLQSFAVA